MSIDWGAIGATQKGLANPYVPSYVLQSGSDYYVYLSPTDYSHIGRNDGFYSVTIDGVGVFTWDPGAGVWRQAGLGQKVDFIHFAGIGDPRATQFTVPESVAARPIPVWPRILSTGGPIPSYTIQSMQWVRILAFVDVENVVLEIPLRDSNDRPHFDPAVPPLPIMRRADDFSADYVGSPSTAGLKWYDWGCWSYPGWGGYNEARNIMLIPATDPVPHWVLRLNNHYDGGSYTAGYGYNFLIDLFGVGMEPVTSPIEVGSSGVFGHYKVSTPWGVQNFNATSQLTDLNGRKFGTGAIDVAHPNTSAFYMTTGGSAGTSAGTSLFTDLPAVMVQGHADLGVSVAGSAETAWKPETWGMGFRDAYSASVNDRNFYSALYYESATSKYRLDITNAADPYAGPADSSKDRTYFVFALGT